MPGFNINTFRSNGLTGGGARPCNFIITLTFPDVVDIPNVAQKLSFTARSSKLPQSAIGEIPVPYFGRTIKVAGNRTYDDWDVTIMNDEDFSVRNAFLEWQNAMNTTLSNRLDPRVANVNPSLGGSYKSTAYVTQFSSQGPGDVDGAGAIAAYKFEGIFPVMVSDIPVDWNALNEIEQFQVTFAYDWYEPYLRADDTEIFPLSLSDDA